MVAKSTEVIVEGTGAPTATGLSVSFLDTVPLKITSGTHVVDYRVSNSTGSDVDFNSIIAKVYGDPRSKFTVTLGHSSLTVPASGSVDSTITVTTTSNLLRGEHATIKISGDAVASVYDFTATITASRTTFEIPNAVFFHCLDTTGHAGDLRYDCHIEWHADNAIEPDVYGPYPCFVWTTTGTQTITCTIYDNAGNVGFGSTTVTGSAFSPTIYYIDTTNVAGGRDGSIGNPYNSYAEWYDAQGTNTNCGVAFKAGQNFIMDVTRDYDIGSGGTQNRWWGRYGTGADPIIEADYIGPTFTSAGGSNFRVTNLDFRGYFDPTYGTLPWTTTRTKSASEACKFFYGINHSHVLFHGVRALGYDSHMAGAAVGNRATNGYICHSECVYDYATIWLWFTSQSDSVTGRTAVINCTLGPNCASDGGSSLSLVRWQQARRSFIWGGTLSSGTGQSVTAGTVLIIEANDGTAESDASRDIYIGYCDFQYTKNLGYGIKVSEAGGTMRIYDVVLDGVRLLAPGGSFGNEALALGKSVSNMQLRNCVAMSSTSVVDFNADATAFPGAGSQGRAEAINCTNIVLNSFSDQYARHLNAPSGQWSSVKCVNGITYAPNAVSGGELAFVIIPSGLALSSLTDSNNLFKCSGAQNNSIHFYIKHGGTTYAFNAIPSGHGAGSSYTDPLLVSTTNPHLTFSSLAINAGLEFWDRHRDRDQVDRSASIDIGAYEYV